MRMLQTAACGCCSGYCLLRPGLLGQKSSMMQYLGLIRHIAAQLYCHAIQHPQLLIRLCLI